MVLLKGADARGLSFFTAYDSRKGSELEANPRAALLFHWSPLGRQVRVEGDVERLAEAESDAYWETRPVASRRSAAASPQSAVVGSRDELEQSVTGTPEDVSRPRRWGGYLLTPS